MGTNREPSCICRMDCGKRLGQQIHLLSAKICGWSILCSLDGGGLLVVHMRREGGTWCWTTSCMGGGSPRSNCSIPSIVPLWMHPFCLSQKQGGGLRMSDWREIGTQVLHSQQPGGSCYRKSLSGDACLTLPGHVVYATTGRCEVVTSCDLNRFLCSETVGKSSPNRSHELFLQSQLSLSDHLIESVFGYTIYLQQPYMGPSVSQGEPLVYLRTNLLSRGDQTINSPTTTASISSELDLMSDHILTGTIIIALPYLFISTCSIGTASNLPFYRGWVPTYQGRDHRLAISRM